MQIICRAFAFLEKFAAVFVNAEILTQSVGLIAGADIFIAVGLAIFRILTFGVFGGTVRTGTAAPHAHLLFGTGFVNAFFVFGTGIFTGIGTVNRTSFIIYAGSGIFSRRS